MSSTYVTSVGGVKTDSTLSVRSILFTGRGTLELLPFDEDSDAVELSTLGIYRSRTFERELLLHIAVCWCYFGCETCCRLNLSTCSHC